jgi:hypothetical protein
MRSAPMPTANRVEAALVRIECALFAEQIRWHRAAARLEVAGEPGNGYRSGGGPPACESCAQAQQIGPNAVPRCSLRACYPGCVGALGNILT